MPKSPSKLPLQSSAVKRTRRKSIHRKHLGENYAVLPNSLLQDKTLSFRSRGILAMMLSMPQDWATHQTWIESQGTEGREAIRAAVKELEAAGYLSRRILFNGTLLAGYEWNWHAEPLPISQRSNSERSPDDGFPSDGSPTAGKPAPTKYPSEKVPTVEKKESKEIQTGEVSPAYVFPEFPATWKPIQGTKEEKLARIKPPTDYPAEWEFDQFIENEFLDQVVCGRPDLYLELCNHKWHQWKERLGKWIPIRDWRKYVQALDTKMGEF